VLSAFVLAAGLGTRLRPLTEELPKPLVPIGDRPALGHAVERLRAAGVRTLVANAFHGADAIDAVAATLGVRVSREDALLGTAGGLRRAHALLGEGDVLVVNGDVFGPWDPAALVAAHADGAMGTLLVRRRARGEGAVGLAADGRVVRLRGERVAEEAYGGDFLGVHVVSAALRARLPERGCLVGDGYIPALRAGGTIGAFCTDAPIFDVGTPSDYLAANLAWLEAQGALAWAHRTASIGAATLDRAIVGAGARIEGDGVLARCVVWPGAACRAPLTDAVVTPRRVVSMEERR
jgi:mannose-1-phosphate guanylyltransferase